MHSSQRLTSERRFHDRQADRRRAYFSGLDSLRFSDDDYLDHETWIRPALRKLDLKAELPVLDLGCGHGMAAVVLARRGADVTALDLSGGYLAEARQRAEANAVRVRFVQADGHRLPFADASFARIWGNAVLHHLDVAIAARELRRVLKPGGRAVFCEPWGENPLLAWARRQFSYAGKERTADEMPLRRCDLTALRRVFPGLEIEGFQLLGMARRVLPSGRLVRSLEWADEHLLRTIPGLQYFCRYLVVVVHS